MSILEDAARTLTNPEADDDADPPATTGRKQAGSTASVGAKFTTQIRGETVQIDGDELTIARPETKQPDETAGNFLVAENMRGVPRGTQAASLRNIVQTASMQSIANGITDQLLGGDLTFLDDEDAIDGLNDAQLDAVGRLKTVIRDVLTGPHMGDEDLDDLVAAAVEDMLGPGNAYWQLLAPEQGDLPVAALTSLDPLTIRHNVDRHGYPEDPPYWQVHGMFQGTSSNLGSIKPVPLTSDDIAVFRFPKGHRSYRRYPVSAAWQVREWLEILADSVTHHKRYYSDNEVPPGLMQVVNATDGTVKDIKEQVEAASGDPRDFPIVGGEAPANWIEMGGTAINLNVIEEQKWFFQMCLGALGLGKQELGFIEDVNRSNGEVEADRVYKRVAGPFGKQFERAFLHVARQFPTFTDLGEPFSITLANTDPRAQLAKEERLTSQLQAGAITPREWARRLGNEDLAEDDDRWQVEIGGEVVTYGDLPVWVAKRKLASLGGTDPDAGGEPMPEDAGGGEDEGEA